MRTNISLPDEVFRAVEQLSRELGVSPSQFVASAVAEFVALRRDVGVTERLNAVYGDGEASLDPLLLEIQSRSQCGEVW